MAALPSKRVPTSWEGLSLVLSSPCPRSAQRATSCHALPADTPWNYAAVAFHQIQYLREKNEEMTPKKPRSKYSSTISPQPSCHLEPLSVAPRTLLGTALTHQRWVCKERQEKFQAKITKSFCSLPKRNPWKKNIITFTLPISSFKHFVGFAASWTHA